MTESQLPSPGAADGSVTAWLELLKDGDASAAKPLWDAYFTRLVSLARNRLGALSRAAADEDDVALSAFKSFCKGASEGRFPRLDDRDDLWQVLFMLTTRKAVGLVRHQTRVKRGGGRVAPLDAGAVAAAGPTPEEAAEVADECARLLARLGPGLRDVAVWKMEGYTNAEIAAKLGRSEVTVERKLADIRALWGRWGGG